MKSGIPALACLSNSTSVKALLAALAVVVAMPQANAGIFTIKPISLVNDPNYSITVSGTIATIGNTSAIDDWSLNVTTIERLAHYSNANTIISAADGIIGKGQQLTIATSPDGSQDGGALLFRSPNRFLDFNVTVADFSGANANGGQAAYTTPLGADALDLNQPWATEYVAAQANAAGETLFTLTPLAFANGVSMSGAIRTDGTSGLLTGNNILAWDIYLDQLTQDTFNKSNSTFLADQLALSPDGLDLTVANPDGYLIFSKGLLGGRSYMLQLADFTSQSPVGGQAGYFKGRLQTNTIDLNAVDGPWSLSGAAQVPEPATLLLFGASLAGLAASRRLGKNKQRAGEAGAA